LGSGNLFVSLAFGKKKKKKKGAREKSMGKMGSCGI
jgi:hypothetical protein